MLISFIIPCFNAAKTLDSVVASIENTCTVPYEIIMVNDGSIDGTEDVAKKIANRSNAFLFSQTNKGVNAARKLGWNKANGDYVCFVDADDSVILNDEILAWLFKDYDIVKAGGWYLTDKQRINYDNIFIGEVYDVASAYNLLLSSRLLPYIHSAFFRKGIITDECFNIDSRFKIGEDLLFNIKVMASCHKFISVPERFYVYSMNEESVMHTKIWGFNYIRDFNDEIDKHILALCPKLKKQLIKHRFIDYTSTLLFPEIKMVNAYYKETVELLNENPWLKKVTPMKYVLFIENECLYKMYVSIFRFVQRLRRKKQRIVID